MHSPNTFISDPAAEPLAGRPSPFARMLRRSEASAYVREHWAFPCSTAWLAKLAVVGGGPTFRRAGRFPIYATADLDDWARSRISAPVRSTSELDAVKGLPE
jgi:hypothetical protein